MTRDPALLPVGFLSLQLWSHRGSPTSHTGSGFASKSGFPLCSPKTDARQAAGLPGCIQRAWGRFLSSSVPFRGAKFLACCLRFAWLSRTLALSSAMSRPEHQLPPEFFYNEDEARKYTHNSRMINIQTAMADRAIHLLNMSPTQYNSSLILDVGCGSGLSGEVLSENGFEWIGLDISRAMLDVALEREDCDGDLILGDMGEGLPFRPGSFDGAISISALQWLCNADFKEANPFKRCMKFFTALYAALRRGARAVLQWYPENADQMEMVTSTAMKCGFTGGMVVDYPHSAKARKYFLCLFCGAADEYEAPKPLLAEHMAAAGGDEDGDAEGFEARRSIQVVGSSGGRRHDRKWRDRVQVKSKEWIQNKKERQRRQGKDVRPDSKYSGRKRRNQIKSV